MDPHKILGIEKGATPEEVHRAYLRQYAKYHPDKGGDAWISQQVQEAYEQLHGKSPESNGDSRKPAPNEHAQPEQPFQHSASASSRRQSESRRKRKSPITELAKIVFGGMAGISIAVLLLWYGFGLDVLGVMESSDESLAKAKMRTDDETDVQRMTPRTEETSEPPSDPVDRADEQPDVSQQEVEPAIRFEQKAHPDNRQQDAKHEVREQLITPDIRPPRAIEPRIDPLEAVAPSVPTKQRSTKRHFPFDSGRFGMKFAPSP